VGGDPAEPEGGGDDPEPLEIEIGEIGEAGEAGDMAEVIEVVEITDVLDLHSFLPREVPDVVRDYLDAAYEQGLRRLRIVHGRGAGVQRRTVRTLLERDPRVVEYGDAPPEAGGWGATWVTLR
jgi:dsDNA-specific endonuclease/ATPase MutS2